MFRFLSVAWAISGVTVLLGYAVLRLSYPVFELYSYPLGVKEIAAVLVSVMFMAYFEGYRGFQRGFSPRVAARVKHLRNHATWFNGLLAPVFCLGFFGTTRKRQISVIILTIGLCLLVAFVKTVPQPWRGVIDAGVVVGLTWGLLSFYYYVFQALTDDTYSFSAELPH